MPKLWTQYDAASESWIPWEANALPSTDSIYRARFLSQFAAWIKYLSAMEQTSNYVDFIYPAKGDYRGTVVQTAAFWQGLNWTPGIVWISAQEADIYKGATIPDITAKMIDSDDYAATEFTDIEKGDIIHPMNAPTCRMRNMLWKLRRRIDMCHTLAGEIESGSYRRRSVGVTGGTPFSIDEIIGGSVTAYTPTAITFPCGAMYRQVNISGGSQVHQYDESRDITAIHPSHMPPDTVCASILNWSENPWGGNFTHTEFPYPETESPGGTIEAVFSDPIESGGTVVIAIGLEVETGIGPDLERVAILHRTGFVHPLATPPEDYLPDESMFND